MTAQCWCIRMKKVNMSESPMGTPHIWRYNHRGLILFFCLTLPSFAMLQQLWAEKEEEEGEEEEAAAFTDKLPPLKNEAWRPDRGWAMSCCTAAVGNANLPLMVEETAPATTSSLWGNIPPGYPWTAPACQNRKKRQKKKPQTVPGRRAGKAHLCKIAALPSSVLWSEHLSQLKPVEATWSHLNYVCLQPPFKEKAADNLHRASKHIFGFSWLQT